MLIDQGERLCDVYSPANQMSPCSLSYSFWSGLSGGPVGVAVILLVNPEWAKPLMKKERGRDWLLSWHVHASHALISLSAACSFLNLNKSLALSLSGMPCDEFFSSEELTNVDPF